MGNYINLLCSESQLNKNEIETIENKVFKFSKIIFQLLMKIISLYGLYLILC